VFIQDNLEVNAIAIAKGFSQENVNENHLLIAACDFLSKHEPKKLSKALQASAEAARRIESSGVKDGFRTPVVPSDLQQRIKSCVSIDDVVSLAENCKTGRTAFSQATGATQVENHSSSGDFHVPIGPNVGRIPNIIPNKDFAAQLIYSFLVEGEIYVWDGPYNTKDRALVTRPGQSMGRLFVTNKRLLFWSDDVVKPHVGLLYDDIQSWKTTWMPLKSRGVTAMIAGRKVLFAANSTAIENAERFIKR
jgi:hypothetical protein